MITKAIGACRPLCLCDVRHDRDQSNVGIAWVKGDAQQSVVSEVEDKATPNLRRRRSSWCGGCLLRLACVGSCGGGYASSGE